MDRTIVIGDVHGCRVELEALLKKVRHRPDCDRLVFLGDLIDRGPDSVGVVRLVRSLGGDCVRGNHEDKHIKYRRALTTEQKKYFPPYKHALNMTLSDRDIDFIAAFPLFLEIDLPDDTKYLVVHAGFQPNGSDPRFQDERIMTSIRYVDQDGKMAKKGTRWASVWRRPENVFYGHHVIATDTPTLDASEHSGLCVSLDTGCVFGGTLTAYVFDGSKKTPEIVSVQALLSYSELKNR